MASIEEAPRKNVLKTGSTTLTIDKDSGKATLQQKILLWSKKSRDWVGGRAERAQDVFERRGEQLLGRFARRLAA